VTRKELGMVVRFERIAVVGGGYMGGGIAQTFAMNGFDCALADASLELAQASVERLQRETEAYQSLGLFPCGALERVKTHLSAARSIEEAVSDADYVAEAVPEDASLKKAVLARVATACGDAVITSNTSAIPISELATTIQRKERFLGAHWMNPAPFVPCVEVIPTRETDEAVVFDVMELLARAGKRPTIVADSPGFVANRLQYTLFKECVRLVEEDIADPAQIDEVVRNSFGFRLPFFGPFAIADIAGLDVYRSGFATMEKAYGERMSTPTLLTDLVSKGRLGAKSLGGIYDFDEAQVAEVAEFRDRAYNRLSLLRQELGELDLRRHHEE